VQIGGRIVDDKEAEDDQSVREGAQESGRGTRGVRSKRREFLGTDGASSAAGTSEFSMSSSGSGRCGGLPCSRKARLDSVREQHLPLAPALPRPVRPAVVLHSHPCPWRGMAHAPWLLWIDTELPVMLCYYSILPRILWARQDLG
jgi:hypothetical protein